jgi:hypothetical protein
VQQNDGLVTDTEEFFTGLKVALASGQIVQIAAVEQGKETFSSSPMLVRAPTLAAAIADSGEKNLSVIHSLIDNPTAAQNSIVAIPAPATSGHQTTTARPATATHLVNVAHLTTAAHLVSTSTPTAAQSSSNSAKSEPEPKLSPATVALAPGVKQTFTLENKPTGPVNWEIDPNVGSLVPNGDGEDSSAAIYTAPTSTGTVSLTGPVIVRATIGTKSSTANVTLVSSNASNPANVTPQTTQGVVDFITGHARSFFTFGVVLSQQGNNFSQASPFLDFQLDKTWWTFIGKQNGTDPDDRLSRFRLNTFFDTRLTAVGSSEIGSTTTPSSGTAAVAAPTVTPATYDSFITTRKAGSLQVGVYAPYELTPDRQYSIYIAPIFKAGFVTPTDTSSQTTTTDTGTAVTTGIVTPRKFFTNTSFGMRLGETQHVVYTNTCIANSRRGNPIAADANGVNCIDTTLAPSNLSYLDVTVGRYGNFEAFNQLTSNGVPTSLLRERPYRLNLEGALQIPNLPLVLGVSANVGGPGHIRAGYIPPQDDLRFFLGFKFDAQRIVTALVTAGTNK